MNMLMLVFINFMLFARFGLTLYYKPIIILMLSNDIQSLKNSNTKQILQEDNQPKSNVSTKFMIGYLYFIQGTIISVTINMPYIYPQLPSYDIISLFSIALLPFSFKFITAPILEKYSNIPYGKRKFWIIISQTITALNLFLSSFFTKVQEAHIFIVFLFLTYFALTLQDISLDALCLKELKSSKQMSTIQAACQSSGIIISGLLILKLTSYQFATSLGRSEPFISIQSYIIALSLIVFIPLIIIHLKFEETQIEQDNRSGNKSLIKVFSIYKYYLKCNYRYCRVLIFQLLFHQGFNFFLSGYNFQLINLGFSKNTLNTIDNIQNGVTTALIFIVGTKAFNLGYQRSFLISLSFLLIIYFILWVFMPIQVLPIIITSLLTGIFDQWIFVLACALSGDFPQTGATGMIFTMSASAFNFGRNKFAHTAILKIIPWKYSAIFGLALQLFLIVYFLPKMIRLIKAGKTEIVEMAEETNSKEQMKEEKEKQQKWQVQLK